MNKFCSACLLPPLAVICFGHAAYPALSAEAWEPVYPEDPFPVYERPFLSFGENLAGSTDGWVMIHQSHWTWGGMRDSWTYVKLSLAFDITAVTKVNGHYLVGGPEGQLAWHANSVGGPVGFEGLSSAWESRPFPADVPITRLAADGSRVVAIAGGRLYVSADEGNQWSLLNTLPEPLDVEAFHGEFHVLFRESAEGTDHLTLMRSGDGTEWESVWRLPLDSRPIEVASLLVLTERRYPYLHVFARFAAPTSTGEASRTLMLASIDGRIWSNNGSIETIAGDAVPWKPFGFPYRLGTVPGRYWKEPGVTDVQDSENYLLVAGRIEHFSEFETNRVEHGKFHDDYAGYSVEDVPVFPRATEATTAKWDSLAIVFDQSQLLEIRPDHTLRVRELPGVEAAEQYWAQLIAVDGTYSGRIRLATSFPVSTDVVLQTDNLQDWFLDEELMKADRFDLIPNNKDIAILANQSLWLTPNSEALALESPDVHRFTFYPPADGLMGADHINEKKVIYRYREGSDPRVFASFDDPNDSLYPKRLSSPDGQTLFMLRYIGSGFETIDAAGVVRQWEVPGMSEIENVQFANGWYYFMNPSEPAYRSRDLLEFEPVVLPDNQPLIHVVGFEGYLYAITPTAVYRQPMEAGYLDSFLRDGDWRHSGWLGWFQVINEEAGDINHLLLGQTWVKPVDDQQFWLRTASLGWIWIRKDWAPWFYRLDDGHWYWLDQDGWPPRAWDDTAKEWVALRP